MISERVIKGILLFFIFVVLVYTLFIIKYIDFNLNQRLAAFQTTKNSAAMAQEAAIAAQSFGENIAAKQASAALNMNLVTNTAYLWFLGGALSIALLYLLTEYLTFKKGD